MKRLLIALVLLPAALRAMDYSDKKALNKAVQQCNPGSQKQAEEWSRLAAERAAAHKQKMEQRQRQIEQEKYRHGMNQ